MMNKPLRAACFALAVSFGLMTVLLIPDVDAGRMLGISQHGWASPPLATETTSSRTTVGHSDRLQGDLSSQAQSRNGLLETARSVDAPRRNRSQRIPNIVLGPNVETDEGYTTGQSRDTFASKTRSRQSAIYTIPVSRTRNKQEFSPVESRLVGMEQRLNQLALAQQTKEATSLEQATQLLQQIQQTNKFQEIQRQLENLQTPATKPAENNTEKAANEDENKPSSKSTKKEAVLKVEPSDGTSEQFSLQIQDAEIAQVLDMLGQLSGVNILAGDDVTGSVTVNLQDVTIEQALQAILRSRGYVFERDDDFIYVMTVARQKQSRKLITKVYRPSYISVQDLQALLTPIMTKSIGKIAVTNPSDIGIASDPESAGGDRLSQQDALLVQDYADVIEEVDRIVAEMDIPPMQVVIDAMILSVKLTDSMEFGVNFSLLNNVGDNLAVSGNGRTLNGASGVPNGNFQSILPATGEFVANAAGLKYGFIQGNISGFIKALEKISDTNLVAAPQLRVINKQKAELIIGDRISYKTLAFNGTQTVENVNFLDSGTKLFVRPFIAPDGLVRLEIHPERSSAVLDATTGLPNQATTEVTTNVMVRDGSTIVIGGLIEEQVVEAYDRVPILGAMPLVGRLFRNKTESITRTELIILITPRIIVEPEAAIEGETLKIENELRSEHFRNNLAAVNRRNLARSHYDRASMLFDRGDLERAQHHVKRALEHSKNDMNALRLQNQIDDAMRQRTQRWLHWPIGTVVDEEEVDLGSESVEYELGVDKFLPPILAPAAEAP